jgi:glucokinase
MKEVKVCVDIGGTKTIFAAVDGDLKVVKQVYEESPKTAAEFKKFLDTNFETFKVYSDTVNISIAGRANKNGKIIYSPNLPLRGFQMSKQARKYFKHINIENDANCFAAYEIFKGILREKRCGLIVVWGTGVGGSLVSDGEIYHGAGLASEIGHIKTMRTPKEDIESLIGGEYIKKRYGYSGIDLHRLAEAGDKNAIKAFYDIGEIFGRYLSSLSYVFDPEIVILGGSFSNSWKFMKDAVKATIKKETIRGKLPIKVVRGKFYVIKGCYFLDKYEKLHN